MPDVWLLKRTVKRFRELAEAYPNDSFYSEYADKLSEIINLSSKDSPKVSYENIHKKYFYCVRCGAEFPSLGVPTKCSRCKSTNLLMILVH